MAIAYLINQYPQTSQTFIRREIAALEDAGLSVSRFTLRPCQGELVDENDRVERERTRAVLDVGPFGLLATLLRMAVTRPFRFARALGLAVRTGWRSDRGLLVNLIYLTEACVLQRWLADCGAQHLHVHFGTNSATVAMLCRRLGGPPYSITMHGPEEFDRPLSLALGEKARYAAFVAVISNFGRSQLYRWIGLEDWPKVQIVRCGVDAAFLDGELSPIPNVPRLLNIGRLDPQKGQLLLIEAARRLRDRGIEFELTIVGDGPLRPRLEHRIERHGLGDRVRLAGWLSGAGVRRELRASRALVMASFAEGLPVVMMEALALGRPVISTTIAGIPELVEPGVSGWLVPAGSVEALTLAMQEALAADPAALARMGHHGASRVAEAHDIRVEAAKLAGLITAARLPGFPEILRGAPAPPAELVSSR